MKLKRPSHPTAIAYLALFVALGGAAYAGSQINGNDLQRRSVRGNKLALNTVTGREVREKTLAVLQGRGQTFSNVGDVMAGDFADGFLRIPGIGRISASCSPDAKNSGFGFTRAAAAPPVAIMTSDPQGNLSFNHSNLITGSGFSGSTVFGPPNDEKGGMATILLSAGTGRNAKRATVIIGALNGGSTFNAGLPDRCRFHAFAIAR